MNIEIVEPTKEYLQFIDQYLSDQDVLELDHMLGDHFNKDPVGNFRNWCTLGEARVALLDGVPSVFFGVHGSRGSVGIPWMVSIQGAKLGALSVQRKVRDVLAYMLFDYKVLTNVIPRFSTSRIRWLKWIGFTVEDHKRTDLYKFTMRT